MQLPRMTTRRWMIAVAVVAVAIGVARLAHTVWDRWDRANNFAHLADSLRENGSTIGGMAAQASSETARREYQEAAVRHRALAVHYSGLASKYRRAARYPWLSMPPDPPEPE